MAQKYGYLANQEIENGVPCVVCDDPHPQFSWTDWSGEGYCCRCGTPYQLKWGTLNDGESYPRCNMQTDFVPVLREFWQTTGATNGLGTFMSYRDYPDQGRGRELFEAWMEKHHQEHSNNAS